MKCGALFLFAVSLAAQPAYEIHGTVSEPGLSGVAGAEVQVSQVSQRTSTFTPSTAFTDGRGQFRLRLTEPGTYIVAARMQGYIPSSLSRPVVLNAERPSGEVRVEIVRPVQLNGRVVDSETLEPMEGVTVAVTGKQVDTFGSGPWVPLPREALATALATGTFNPEDREALLKQVDGRLRTKPDGRFSIATIPIGQLAVTLAPEFASPWSLGFTAVDLKSFDTGYESLYWPGGVSADLVRPLALTSGAVVSLGDMRVNTTRLYRAHVSLPQGSCPAGESMRLTLYRRGAQSRPSIVAPCGNDLLLRGLERGTYAIYGVSDWQAYRDNIEQAAWATAEFDVSDENVEVALVPRAGVTLEGRLVLPPNVTELPDPLGFNATPEPLMPGIPLAAEEFFDRGADGTFRMVVFPRPFDLRLQIPPPFYVGRVLYNGSPIAGLRVPVNPGATAHRLEIVLDNNSGVITGTSKTSTTVALWKEGMTAPTLLRVFSGLFSSGPLVPGDYRVMAVAEQTVPALALLMTQGEKVTVRSGETARVELR